MTQEFRQAISDYNTAGDMATLARLIYVRVLFRVFAQLGGKSDTAKPIAYQTTADILHQIVGYHFTIADVLELIEDPDDTADPIAENGASKDSPAPAEQQPFWRRRQTGPQSGPLSGSKRK